MNQTRLKHVLLSFVLLVTPLLIGGGVYVAQSNSTTRMEPDSHWKALEKRIGYQVNHFPGTSGIVIVDLKRGWTIEYNADMIFPSASLIKVPVMIALYDAQTQGRISLDETLSVERRLKAGGSGKLKYMRSGTKITIRQLIYTMITESDNTATNMLTDYLGLDYYNSFFSKLGLTQTNFARMIMDLRKRNQGIENYTTPREMAKLLEMIYEKRFTGSDEMLAILRDSKTNDRLGATIPAEWNLCHKTGLMRNCCHDVGVVFSPSSNYVICVLTSEIRNFRRAKNFISEIAYLTKIYYGDPTIQPPEPKKSFWNEFLDKIL